MTTTAQSIDELIATNPDSIGEMSDAQINALIDGGSLPDGDKASEAAPDLTSKEEAKNEVDETADILTKDGKNYIPNKVLVAARETAAQAEARALAESAARQQAEAKASALEEQLIALKAGNANVDKSGFYSDEELTVLAEDMPEVAERIKAHQERLVAQSTQLEKQSKDIALSNEDIAAKEVQDAIDSVPLLATLQATDTAAFNKAVAIDDILRNDPEYKSLSMSERFLKVAERYELVYGKPSKEVTIDTSKQTVKEALDKANKETAVPVSIADIGGGAMPAVNEDLATAGKTAGELADMFTKMTPAQMDAYLARVIQ